jgi:glycosyltransferase involved in cell wall biosynthesis
MIVAIDCRYILDPANRQFGGISECTDGLARALLTKSTNEKFVLFFSDKYSSDLAGEKAGVTIVRVPAGRGRFLFNHFVFPRLVRSYKPDIFFSPHGQLPLGWRGRAVIAVHDLAIYDHPEWFPGGFSRWFSTKLVVPFSLRRAERIIAVSEATKRDMIRLFKLRPERIAVVCPAALPHKMADRPLCTAGAVDRYFLSLGTIEPRKNFILAVQAMKIFHQKFPDYKLLLAGQRGWKFETTVNELSGVDFVEEVGYVSLEKKSSLLARAIALVFPSFYEGFGLPPLEAMAAGLPVITTGEGALPEVCGEAVRYVSPHDPVELAAAMEEMIDEKKRKNYVKKGLAQSQKFSWARAAGEILKIFYAISNS